MKIILTSNELKPKYANLTPAEVKLEHFSNAAQEGVKHLVKNVECVNVVYLAYEGISSEQETRLKIKNPSAPLNIETVYSLDDLKADLGKAGILYDLESTASGRETLEISGFSKSGTAEIYWNEESMELCCETRYGTLDKISEYDDLVSVAYRWWYDYRDRGYELPQIWENDFLRLGLIKKIVETRYEPT